MINFKNKCDEFIYKRFGFDPEKINAPHGYLDIYVREKGKVIYEDHGPNQIMTWLKMPLAYLLAGYVFSSFGEHTGYLDDEGQMAAIAPFTQLQDYYVNSTTCIDNPSAGSTSQTFGCPWRYRTGYIDATANGQSKPYGVYDRLLYNDTDSWTGGSSPEASHTMTPGDNIYPLMITKYLFGKGGIPGSAIDADRTVLENPTDGEGDPAPFVMIDREHDYHINISATQGSGVNNKVVFQVTLPDLAYGATGTGSDYPYDGVTINEVGLYCSAGLVIDPDTPSENADMETGILCTKRYFNGITKEQSVSFTFVWSVYF